MTIDEQTKLEIQNRINKILNNSMEENPCFIINANNFLVLLVLECRERIKNFDANKANDNFKKIINISKILQQMQNEKLLYDNFNCPENVDKKSIIQKAVSEILVMEIENYQHLFCKIEASKITNDKNLNDIEKKEKIKDLKNQVKASKHAVYSSLMATTATQEPTK